jgi:hypothetical protein
MAWGLLSSTAMIAFLAPTHYLDKFDTFKYSVGPFHSEL